MDERGSSDVRRADHTVGDRVRFPGGEQRPQRFEVALLVEPRVEHLGRPAAHRQEEIEPDPQQRERAVERANGAGEPGLRALRDRLVHDDLTGDRFDARGGIPP